MILLAGSTNGERCCVGLKVSPVLSGAGWNQALPGKFGVILETSLYINPEYHRLGIRRPV